jgi:ketosteroid isomerase-like protein
MILNNKNHFMIKSSIYFLLLTLTVANSTSGQSKDEIAVTVAVENLRKAMIDGDKAALEKLTCTELSYGHSSGKIEDKAAFIDALASGKSDFVSIELSGQTIAIAGNAAIVRHKLNGTTLDAGKTADVHLFVLTVWQKQKKEWKLLARQAAKIPTP